MVKSGAKITPMEGEPNFLLVYQRGSNGYDQVRENQSFRQHRLYRNRICFEIRKKKHILLLHFSDFDLDGRLFNKSRYSSIPKE